MTAPLPFTVLTGFLGSGKTTLLRALLPRPELARALVLVNEAGEIALDHLLVRHAREEVTVLASGCVCCTLRADLVQQLTELLEARDAGRLSFDRVVLETTGLADGGPVVQTLLTHPVLSERLYLDGVIVTVDAQHGAATLAQHEESKRQLALADRVLLTKTDLVDEGRIAHVTAKIRAVNPDAPIRAVTLGEVDPRFVLNVGHLDTRPIAHHHHPHDHETQKIAVTLSAVNFRAFSLWTAMTTQLYGPYILRLKAVITAKGEPTPIAVQAVHHVVYPPLTLPAMPELEGQSHVVLLTRGLDANTLRELESTLRELQA